jgi:hypothetical protein
VSDPQQHPPFSPEELASLYRRVLGREPTAREMGDLRRWHEELRQAATRALDMARRTARALTPVSGVAGAGDRLDGWVP